VQKRTLHVRLISLQHKKTISEKIGNVARSRTDKRKTVQTPMIRSFDMTVGFSAPSCCLMLS